MYLELVRTGLPVQVLPIKASIKKSDGCHRIANQIAWGKVKMISTAWVSKVNTRPMVPRVLRKLLKLATLT